jgi:hypothetical protein
MPDAPTLIDGDERFVGVDARHHPAMLPPGLVSEAVNLRCRDGVWETRRGLAKVGWTNNVSASGLAPWGTVYGWGEFRDAAGLTWQIIAADGNVYAALANNFPLMLTVPAGETLALSIHFTQAGGELYLFRGLEHDPLLLTDLMTGFATIADPEPALGVERIPRGTRALFVGNRLWVMAADEIVWASDLFYYDRYSIANQFFISRGTPDSLVTIALFGENDIICLKEKSVWRLTNVVGTLAALQLLRVTQRYGCVAADSAVDVGTDFLWMSPLGIASLTLTELGEIQAGANREKPAMFSDPIEPYIRRLSGPALRGVAMGIWDEKLYVALPLDNAEVVGREWITNARPNGVFTGTLTGLTVGATFRFYSANSETLTNGTETVTNSGDFAVQTGTVTVACASSPCVASLKQVWKGVNSALFIYDLKTGAWQGYDESAGISFKMLRLATYLGKPRLFIAAHDGWIYLHEEDYVDAVSTPYLDVIVPGTPAAGDTVRVNGGTLVTAAASATNSGANWGITGLPGNKLFTDNAGTPGYNTFGGGTPWTCPGAQTAKGVSGSDTGVRFYSTNGLAPTVVMTGSWATTTTVTSQDIPVRLVTRGYVAGAPLEFKQGRKLTLQLQTWNPTYSVATRVEGVNQDTTHLTDETRSRVVYDRPFTRANWDPTNVNDDFATSDRQDYSLELAAVTPITLGGGMAMNLHQERTHRLRASGRGRAPQIILTSTQGRVRLLTCGYEGHVEQRAYGVKSA